MKTMDGTLLRLQEMVNEERVAEEQEKMRKIQVKWDIVDNWIKVKCLAWRVLHSEIMQ